MFAACSTADASSPFIPVSVRTLRISRAAGIGLYVQEPRSGLHRLYCEKGVALTESDLEKLLARGITSLFVTSDEYANYLEQLRQNLPAVLADESVPVVERFAQLNDVVRKELADCFRHGDVDNTVTTCRHLAGWIVDVLCRKDATADELLAVLHHDYHTFTHSANVAYYCVLLAKALGTVSGEEMLGLAAGALLHDLGKLEIPENILTKPGALTAVERAIVQEHPHTGFLKLCQRRDMSHGQLMMVYQHHERINGEGYPVRHTGPEIHDWAKLCAVVDVYEALTSRRPYGRSPSRAAVFAILDRDSGTALDKEMLACWIQAIAPT